MMGYSAYYRRQFGIIKGEVPPEPTPEPTIDEPIAEPPAEVAEVPQSKKAEVRKPKK